MKFKCSFKLLSPTTYQPFFITEVYQDGSSILIKLSGDIVDIIIKRIEESGFCCYLAEGGFDATGGCELVIKCSTRK